MLDSSYVNWGIKIGSFCNTAPGQLSQSRACRQTGRWLHSQSNRQAVRATDSWREWCLRNRSVPLHQSSSRGPSQQQHFPPGDAAPWLDTQLLHQHCWPRASICSPDLLACTQTHALTHLHTQRIKTCMYIFGHIYRPGQDRRVCSPSHSTLSLL